MDSMFAQARSLFSYSQSLRRDFHRHPELGFKEVRTAGVIARELRALGLEVTTGVAETGVVALLEGDKPGPVVLARFDMDALPVEELTGAEYASENPGVMHACGHDGHIAIGLTVARMLAALRNDLTGTVKLVFQPAEEGLGGAKRMLDQGVLENPRPDTTLAMHLWNERPIGWAAVVPGPLMAGGDFFSVKIIGKGGHGAMPQNTVDPVAAAAQWITALQSIVSRNIHPLQSGVVSVTSIHGGDTFNVIPPSVEMLGTLRSFEPDVRGVILERFEQVLQGISAAMGCTAEFVVRDVTPAVVNDPETTRRLQSMLEEKYPELQLDTQYRSMVSEDMAFLMQEVPGCYLLVGSANMERGLTGSHHHPKFNFDEEALPIGAAVMASAILTSLKK